MHSQPAAPGQRKFEFSVSGSPTLRIAFRVHPRSRPGIMGILDDFVRLFLSTPWGGGYTSRSLLMRRPQRRPSLRCSRNRNWSLGLSSPAFRRHWLHDRYFLPQVFPSADYFLPPIISFRRLFPSADYFLPQVRSFFGHATMPSDSTNLGLPKRPSKVLAPVGHDSSPPAETPSIEHQVY